MTLIIALDIAYFGRNGVTMLSSIYKYRSMPLKEENKRELGLPRGDIIKQLRLEKQSRRHDP